MQEQLSPSARIAIVEDEDDLRELIVSDLRSRGLAVTGMASAEALYRHMSVNPCHVVVLDVGLPGEDGYGIARHLRQMSSIGILMLTARGGPGDMARGLNAGADLYLMKPVDPDVLAAAVMSLLRRLAIAPATPALAPKADDWSLRADGWSLRLPQGGELALGKAERAFLRALLAQPGLPVDRETLMKTITDQPWDFDPHRLEVLVHRLRARVKSITGQVLPVRAVRGMGYLFVSGDSAGE